MKPEEKGDASAADVREAALRLLARREHSHRELTYKLKSRGLPLELIEATLADLSAERLLSDSRFAEEYVRGRMNRGYGPTRIRAELQERGIDAGMIDHLLAGECEDLRDQLEAARQKRFGQPLPGDMKERARQARFLQQRGFPMDLVNRVLGGRD